MTHTRETPLPCVEITFEWYEGGLVFRIFIFLFRINGQKAHLDENDFRHCYGNFFKSAVLKVT